MIQQTNSVNNNNVIKQRLIQLCEQDSVQVGAVSALVKNLFQIQQIQNTNSNLLLLIQAVIQLANLPYLTPKASNTIIDVIISMLKQAKQLQYKVGVYCLSQLLAQPRIMSILSDILFQSNSEASQEIIQRNKQINNYISTQNIQILCQKLSQNNIKSQMILTSLGAIKLLLTIVCLHLVGEAQNKKDNQKILRLIVRSCEFLLKERHKNISKEQILIFLHICIHLQHQLASQDTKNLIGFQLGWDLITLVFSAQNLEKKLSALSALDILIQEVNKKLVPGQTQIKNGLSKKVLNFLKLILQPRNHEQILNRSLNFLLFWIQNVQFQNELQGLTDWLVHLIFKSDIRTSNIFGNCWEKLIQKIDNIGSLQINTIYRISINILEQMKHYKNQSTIQARSRQNKEKQINQLEVKIMKIISPLIKKQFLQVSVHGEATCKYLTYISQILEQFSPSLSAKIAEQMKKSIVAGTSVAFNCHVLTSNIHMLNQLVNKYNLKQNQTNLSTIENKISLIYSYIHCYLSWILKLIQKTTYIDQQNPEQSKQIIHNTIQFLTNQQLITNLIISHNPSNSQQLQKLLELSNLIIQCVNEREFEYKFLHWIMNKVDNADEIFIIWLKEKLYFIQNMNFKKSITLKLFVNPQVYSNIRISALKQLLEILSMSDLNNQEKQLSCLSILKQIDDQNRRSAINLILTSMWSLQEISKQHFLNQIATKIQKMNYTDCQQLQVYLQINQICSKYNPIKSDRLFSENVAMQEVIQIRIIIQQQNISKVIKCSDSISFAKIRKNQIQPLINSEYFAKISILSLKFQKKQIPENNYLLTLRKLGFKSNQMNQIHVILRQKSYLLIKNLKDGTLNDILSNFYTYYVNSKDLVDIFTKNQWKSLHKYLENEIVKEKNIKLQNIIKQNLLIVLKKAIKKLLNPKQHHSQKIIQQLADFLTQIDEKQLLKNQISEQNGYSHCIFMSRQDYFSKKALNLFKDYQNQNMQVEKKKRFHQHKIAYQFMNTIIVGEFLEKTICGELDYYIQQRSISQKYYMIAFGLECLWITLKNSQYMVMFIQSNKFTDIFKMLARYCQQLLHKDCASVKEEELQIYCKIMITAMKIVNKIWTVILLKSQYYQGILITRNSKDLLNLQQTKRNIQEIKSIVTLDQLVAQDKDIPQIVNIQGRCQFSNLNIEEIIFITIGICNLMKKIHNSSQTKNVFLLFYEASKLNCWLIIQNIQFDQQKKIIQFSIKNLNNECTQLSSVCKSILYIYLILHPESQLELQLFQQFKANINNSKAFYQIFGQSFAISQNSQTTNSIVQTFFNSIMDMKPEENQAPNQPLSEILQIINKNVTKFDQSVCQNFLAIMMNSYLFDYSGEIKAVHPKTRKIIYQSVQQCLRVHQQIEVQPIFKQIIQQINIGNSCQSLIKQNNMGVGLQNLGNICYMNSELQLLHSIKPFVNLINQIKTQFPLLLGLQKLFLNLTHSLNKSISPQEFILSFEPPVDVSLQEDTTQFLIQFLDKLQAGEKDANLPQEFKNLFKGQTQSSMECSKCKKSKVKYEDFLLYSLNIKNENKHFSTLEQCIQNSKNPQIIYDVNCDQCNQKTTFNKKTKLRKIPNYLFINLKRLIFDYSNPYTKIKIHSRLQFPDELKINEQVLVLKAVITHSGTGEYGHYFTSVKENQKWIIYNDSKVYPMPDNGKEDIWYGSLEIQGEISYSTNAYVLLYQKTPTIKHKEKISNKQILEEIKKTNKVLFTKQILFGQRYLRDFVNFAYNIAKLPKNPNKYLSIYQLLGSVSFCHNKIIEVQPNQYFLNLENNSNPEHLINFIYQYKQHNNQLLFHRNHEIRSFFSKFLITVFGICVGKSQLTLVYACQLLKNYISLIKENHNFVISGQYTKLIASLLRDLFKSPQFMKEYFQSKIATSIISLYKARKLQISHQYQTGVQIMEPFIELLLSFVCYVKNQQSGMVLQFINQYQQDFFQIRQVVKNDTNIIQLIFLNNSNSQYIKSLFEFLQLNREQSYLKTLVELTTSLICNWNVVDIKFCKNFSFLVLYLYEQYYSYNIDRKNDFNRSILGVVFPYKIKNAEISDQRVVSLKERTYEYLTSKLQPSLIEIISRILISITNEQRSQIDTLEAVDILLKLLIEILKKDKLFVRIFNNLCSPIGLYGDFYVFIQNQTNLFLDKISQREIIITDNNSEFEEKKKKLQESIQVLRTILKVDNIESQTILCGTESKKPQQIIESLINNNIFVRVEECCYYWVGFKDDGKSYLQQHVTKQYKLKEGQKNIELTKIMKPQEQAQIQQEDPSPIRIKSKKTNHQQIDMEHNLQINSSAVRRKFIFSNTGEQQCTAQINIICANMKNENIQVIFKLVPGQSKEIWVQKKKMNVQWGYMKVLINGSELQISYHESMDMDEGINNFDAIMVENISINQNDAMMQ